jgi:hypothetical protein
MRFEEINAAAAAAAKSIDHPGPDQVPKAVRACSKLIERDNVFAFVAPLGTP